MVISADKDSIVCKLTHSPYSYLNGSEDWTRLGWRMKWRSRRRGVPFSTSSRPPPHHRPRRPSHFYFLSPINNWHPNHSKQSNLRNRQLVANSANMTTMTNYGDIIFGRMSSEWSTLVNSHPFLYPGDIILMGPSAIQFQSGLIQKRSMGRLG